MAAGDIALNVLIRGSAGPAIGAFHALGGALSGLVGGGFSLLSRGFGNILFGLNNLKTAGTVGMDALKQGAVQAGTGFLKFGAILGLVGVAAAIALGVASVKMAGDFQTAVLSLVAHAGLARSQIDNVSQGILQMAPIVGRSPVELADALYPILSAFSGITNQGAKASLSLATLKNSFEAVAGTTTNGTDVANAAVGTFNALGLATNNVALNTKRMNDLFDTMDLTVQLGNMRWETYKNVISKLAVSIQGTGISFKEASAALATMTNEGFSAQRAQTYLSNTFTTIAIKTDALAKHAKKLGIEFDQSKYGPMSLAQKIEYLNQITDGNKQKLLALMGNNATALKTFNALSVGLDAYKSNLQSLQHAHGALQNSFQTASQGFQFAGQRMKAAWDVVLVTIGTQLLPILTPIINRIATLLGQFAAWLVSSGALKNAIQFVVGVFTTLVNIGGAVISFFQHNEVAMSALKATLILAAIVIGVVLAAALWSAAAAAWGFTIALLANPITWIVIAIIAVITLIILAINHWGQITAWLGSVWKAFSTWFMGLWNGIKSWVGNFFSGLGSDFHNFWNGIVSFIHAALQKLVDTITAPFRAIGQLFIWLYNHNYYFKALVDFIVKVVTNVVSWLRQTWQNIVNWIVSKWNDLKEGAIITFTLIYQFISTKISQVRAFLTSILDAIASFIFSKLNAVKDTFGNIFSQIGTDVHQKITDLWNGLKNFVSGWPAQAVQWGVNLIKGFISGITSMIGNVASAVGNIAHTVAGFLGFHSPTRLGAGRDAHLWAPAFVNMYTAGLLAGIPKVQAAFSRLTTPATARGGFGISGSNALAFALSGSGQPIIIQIQPADVYLDKKKVGSITMQHQAKEIRLQGNYRNA